MYSACNFLYMVFLRKMENCSFFLFQYKIGYLSHPLSALLDTPLHPNLPRPKILFVRCLSVEQKRLSFIYLVSSGPRAATPASNIQTFKCI